MSAQQRWKQQSCAGKCRHWQCFPPWPHSFFHLETREPFPNCLLGALPIFCWSPNCNWALWQWQGPQPKIVLGSTVKTKQYWQFHTSAWVMSWLYLATSLGSSSSKGVLKIGLYLGLCCDIQRLMSSICISWQQAAGWTRWSGYMHYKQNYKSVLSLQ